MRKASNFKLESRDLEKVKGISMTIPDMSYTIKELLEKFTSGIMPPVMREGQYPDYEPGFDNMDETRIPDFDLADATAMKHEIEERENQRKQKRDEYLKNKQQQNIDNEVSKRLQELQNKQNTEDQIDTPNPNLEQDG